MKTVQTAYILAIGTRFATEALCVCAVLNGQILLVKNDIAIDVCDRYFGSRNQIEIIYLTVVHLSFFVGQLSRSITRRGIHYRGRHNLRITTLASLVEEEVD